MTHSEPGRKRVTDARDGSLRSGAGIRRSGTKKRAVVPETREGSDLARRSRDVPARIRAARSLATLALRIG
ncbi:unnamed protein product [Lampetra planeri]